MVVGPPDLNAVMDLTLLLRDQATTGEEQAHAMYGNNPRSTAQIAGHPIHPLLIPFPIVSFIGVLVTDVMWLTTREGGWATASNWLLGVGLVTALLAAAAGMAD